MWPHINNRFNYPVKAAMVTLTDEDALDMEDPITRYCSSSLLLKLSDIGIPRVVDTWNEHTIAGTWLILLTSPNIL